MNRKLAFALLVLANLVWGSSHSVAKVTMETLPPTLLASLRFCLATAVLWPLLIWQHRQAARGPQAAERRLPPRGDMLRLMALGLFGSAVAYLLAYTGVSLTTATEASLMIIGEVMFTALLAWVLLGERIGRRRGLGIVLGSAGAAVLVLGGIDTGGGSARALGNALILAGLLCEAFYTVLGTSLAGRYNALTVVTLIYSGSLLVWAPMLAWYVASGHIPAISPAVALGVVYLALGPSIICNLLWFTGLPVAGANAGAVALFVQPLVGSLIGLVLLDDPLSTALVAGGALIFTALYLTIMPEPARTDAPEPAVRTAAGD